MKTFQSLKNELLKNVAEVGAYGFGFNPISESKDIYNLMNVVKTDFRYLCDNDIITECIINEYKEIFNSHDIFCNESRESGYLLVTGNVERIGGTCQAFIKGNSKVNTIYGNAYIHGVIDNSEVYNICGNAYVDFICDNAIIYKTLDNAIVDTILGKATIINNNK